MIFNIECQECNGMGYTEELKCDRAASMCCGGCYEETKCQECNGVGFYDVDVNIENIKPFIESGEIESEKI